MQHGPVVLYTRVSTEEQSKEGYSIEAQEKVLRAYCVVKGYENVTLYSDPGFSAKNTNRPALKEMLERIRQGGVEAMIVWRLDRLSRSLKDTLHIVEDILQPAGTQLVSSSESIDTSTPSGRLMLNVLASFAQAERENTQERIQMVNTELAKVGHHLGGVPPFGYKVVEGKYIIDERAAEAVRTLYQMFVNGSGYASMAKYLSDNGFKTARGNDFSKASLHDMLKNEKYTGVYIWNKSAAATKSGTRNNHQHKQDSEIIRIPGAIPTIVPRPLWVKAQETFKRNRMAPGRFSAKHTYLLSGIIYCAQCGAPMKIKSGSKDRDGTKQRYYVCPHKCCRAARKEDVEDFVLITIKIYLMQEDVIRAAIDAANTMSDTAALEDAPQIARPNTNIEDITNKLDSITQFIAENGTKAPASLINETQNLEAQRAGLETERQIILDAQKRIDAQRVIDTLKEASEMANRPPDEQKRLMQQTVRSVLVSDDQYKIILDCTLNGGGDTSFLKVQSESKRSKQINYTLYNYRVTSVINVINKKNHEFLPMYKKRQKSVTLYVTRF